MEFLGKALALMTLSAALLWGTVAWSQPRASNCDQRIRNAEHRLHQAIRRYGAHSRQAQKRRERLERVRSRCHM